MPVSSDDADIIEEITAPGATPLELGFIFEQTLDFHIEWKGSPNFWSGRNGQQAIAICDHIMEGSMAASNDWFKNRRADASSHFGVARDGRIWQWVKVEDTAWANGPMQQPDLSIGWLADCFKNEINPNHRTISIEHEGHSGEAFTEKQYQATLWLHRYLCGLYNIQAERQFIIGHYQIMAHDRAHCPGPAFPWARLMSDLSHTTNPFTPPVASTDIPTSKWAQGVTGVIMVEFGPAIVLSNNTYVRKRPSLLNQNGSLLRTLSRGKILRFSGYTDAGPAFQSKLRWYLIVETDGGGWVHSSMVALQ